jgi:hypothetical protein
MLSFLDCYSGYHQIALKEEDKIKTTFIPHLVHMPTQLYPSG